MTILQNIAIVAIVIILEIFIVFISSVFSEKDEKLTIAVTAISNATILIVVLLIWANGIKFPLK